MRLGNSCEMQNVKAIRNLNRLRRASARALREVAGAVAANDANGGMGLQPGCEGLSFGIGQHIDGLVAFQIHVGGLIDRTIIGAVGRIALAAAAMGAAIWPLSWWLAEVLAGLPGARVAVALVPVVVGAGVYFLAARLLRIPEARALVRRFR